MRVLDRLSTPFLLAVASTAILSAQQPPTFRAEIDSVQLDLRIVDERGRFVRDIAREELQVYEDGQPQSISTFAVVDIPIEPVPATAGRLASDVATNAGRQGRLYVMLLDNLNTHPLRAVTVRELAKYFVDHHLEPADRLAIVTTGGNRDVSQEFTANRERLHAVIDRFQAHSLPPADAYEAKQTFLDAQSTIRSMKALATWLGTLSGRRKAIVLVSEGIKFDIANEGLNPGGVMNPDVATLVDEMRDLVTAATRANVSIYPIDAHGLPTAPAPTIKPVPQLVDEDPFSSGAVNARQSLHELADVTGGVALVRSNDFEQAFDRIVEEASAHYLLGYSPTNLKRDGRFRKIEVRTTRPGVTVRARSGYVAERERGDGTPRAPAGMPRELADALQSPLAVSGLTLSVFAAPYRGAGARAAVGVVVQATGSDVQVAETQGRFKGSIEVIIAAADAGGRIRDSERGTLSLRLRPESRERIAEHGVRLLSRLDLNPGRYQLRVAAMNGVGATRGSIQYDLDVPDFTKGPLAMSGVVLTSAAARAPLTGDVRFWQERAPVPPALARQFSMGDELTAFAEIYTNDQKAGQVIDIVTTVENERGTVFASHRESLTTDMTQGRSATYRHAAPIPIPTIPPGSYVLTVRAETPAAPDRFVRRQVPIAIR